MPLSSNVQRNAFSLFSKLAPAAAGKIIYKSSFKINRHLLPENETILVQKAQQRQLIIDVDRTVQVYEWGHGPVIFMVHGWRGRAAQFYMVVDSLLAAGYKIVAFDAPGHGQSSGEQSDVPSFTKALLALAKEYKTIELIISHSVGGLAVAKAIEEGLNVKNAILISPPKSLKNAIDTELESLALAQSARTVYWHLCEKKLGADIWEKFNFDRLGSYFDRLENVTIIHDHNDREIPWTDGDRVSKAIKKSRLITTHGLGHRRILRSEKILELIAPSMPSMHDQHAA